MPLQQSQLIIARFKEAGVPCELVIKAGERPRLGEVARRHGARSPIGSTST